MRVFGSWAFCILVSFGLSACVTELSHLPLDSSSSPNGKAMTVIGFRGDTAFVKVELTGEKKTVITMEMLKKADPFSVFSLPPGHYKIEKVWLNDVWFLKLTDDDDAGLWEFDVVNNAINYVGTMVITKNSSDNYYVRIHNRSAEFLDYLESKYPDVASKSALVNAEYKKDKFFEIVKKLNEATK